MSNNDKLFSQIDLFEKLASFGKREDFLNKLSQQGTEWSEEEKQQLDPRDILGHPQAEGIPPIPPNVEGRSLPKEAPKAAPHAAFPFIPAKTQQMLSQLLAERGQFIPLKIDQKLGPQTQKALDIFKKEYNAQNLSGAALYNEIERAFNTYQAGQKSPAEGYQFQGMTPKK